MVVPIIEATLVATEVTTEATGAVEEVEAVGVTIAETEVVNLTEITGIDEMIEVHYNLSFAMIGDGKDTREKSTEAGDNLHRRDEAAHRTTSHAIFEIPRQA
jgi:hypothetical protein